MKNTKYKTNDVSKKYEDGTKRVKSKDLKLYEKKKDKWLPLDEFPKHTKEAIFHYHKNKSLDILIDEISKDFLKGFLNSKEIPSGKRVQVLPNQKKLARGGFSLFAKELTFNMNAKNAEWDVCYTNTSGLKTYLYSEEKLELEHKKKAKLVDSFIEKYPEIIKKLEKDLKREKTIEYLTLYTLIKTHIRVGNLEYYNHLKHKGLTTLQKQDISINSKTCKVTFDFIGKDGVPQHVEKEFPKYYIEILNDILKKKKKEDFVFTDKNNHPLHSSVFTDILYGYTKEHFYPHIIRSYYADTTILKFIEENKRKKLTKKDIENKFYEIANELGHKKFNKKKNKWVLSYAVTIENYIRPKYALKMKKLYERKA